MHGISLTEAEPLRGREGSDLRLRQARARIRQQRDQEDELSTIERTLKDVPTFVQRSDVFLAIKQQDNVFLLFLFTFKFRVFARGRSVPAKQLQARASPLGATKHRPSGHPCESIDTRVAL